MRQLTAYLRRTVRAFFAVPQETYLTGEDIQLSFALQQFDIPSIKADSIDEASAYDLESAADAHASWSRADLQAVRYWLFCRLMLKGYRPIRCSNCDIETVRRCVTKLELNARALLTASS